VKRSFISLFFRPPCPRAPRDLRERASTGQRDAAMRRCCKRRGKLDVQEPTTVWPECLFYQDREGERATCVHRGSRVRVRVPRCSARMSAEMRTKRFIRLNKFLGHRGALFTVLLETRCVRFRILAFILSCNPVTINFSYLRFHRKG